LQGQKIRPAKQRIRPKGMARIRSKEFFKPQIHRFKMIIEKRNNLCICGNSFSKPLGIAIRQSSGNNFSVEIDYDAMLHIAH
jgi:hypothetical protein